LDIFLRSGTHQYGYLGFERSVKKRKEAIRRATATAIYVTTDWGKAK
jgi:hypothetical protein